MGSARYALGVSRALPDGSEVHPAERRPSTAAALALQAGGLVAANAFYTWVFAGASPPPCAGGACGPDLAEALALGIAAPVEEGLFRGLLFEALARTRGPAAAITGSALLFGLAHGVGAAGGIAFLLGLQLGALRARYSLGAAIAAHLANNAAVLAARTAAFGAAEAQLRHALGAAAQPVGLALALGLAGSAIAALAQPAGRR